MVVDSLNNRAKNYFKHDDSLSYAIEALKESYFIADRNNYASGIIKSANMLARGYLYNSEYAKSANKSYMAMRHAEYNNDSSGVAEAYWGLGLVMYQMSKWSDAIRYFDKSQRYDTAQSGNPLIQYLLGLCFYNLHQYELAEEYLTNSKRDAEMRSDTMRLLEIRLYQNHILLEQGVDSAVMDEYATLIDEFGSRNERVGQCYASEGLARAYIKLQDFKQASSYANKALDLARSVHLTFPLKSILAVVIEAEQNNGEYEDALNHMIELQEIRNNTIGANSATEIAMLTADHDFQKKEAEFDAQLEEQHRQRYLLIILVIGFFIVSLVIFFSLQGVAKERKRSDQLLHNILPVETAKELKATGKAAAKAHKEVTIVFADVKNFTQIAESLEPQSLVKMLDKYFSGFDQIINQFGIEKIKTIGDAYMFVSGLHVNDNHAIKAVNASMAMLDSVKKLEEDMLNTFGTSFAFRIGIHSGRTISGVVGKIKYAFDIWGDSVNIAARMEAQSEPGRINISDRTHQLVKDSIPCTYRGEMAVKNKGNMAMYFVD